MTVNGTDAAVGRQSKHERTTTNRRARGSEQSMRRVLWWLIGSTRGGRNRFRIVRALDDQPMNTNQLSKELDLNYKTVAHHLDRLVEHGVLLSNSEDYGTLYFLTDRMEHNRDVLDEIAAEIGIEDA